MNLIVVAITCQNGTRSLLTSAKLSVGYLVVGITRELNKEPSLHCYPIVIATTHWNSTHSMLTSAKLLVGYLVVGLQENSTRSPCCIHLLYIYMAPGPCYNNIYLALKSMYCPHVLLLIHMCFP